MIRCIAGALDRGARTFLLSACATLCLVPRASAQAQGEREIDVIGRLGETGGLTYSDIEIEQEPGRPYVYLSRIYSPNYGFDVVSIEDPAAPEVIYRWRIENQELHLGLGAMDSKYFKLDGRYYIIQSVQFAPGGPDADVGAIVFDVTGLPDPSSVREVGRIRAPDTPGGFHNIFAYKHSDGRALLFTTTGGRHANVYDLRMFLEGDVQYGLIGRVPWPATAPDMTPYGPLEGYHDFYAAYDPGSNRDLLYGAGYNGYYIYDVSVPEAPTLATSIVGVLGLQIAHTLTATPDAKYAVGQTEYVYSPVRIYDLRAGLAGQVQTISEEIGAWSSSWDGISHNNEMRWPYVFVSSYKEGMHVFDITDPKKPVTVAHYDTYHGNPEEGIGIGPTDPDGIMRSPFNGAFGIDVRNYDGLVVVSDVATGLYVLRVDGFDGWNGADHGMPNISSVQDWDDGPRAIIP